MQNVLQHVPVTALALYGSNYILSGEGTYLHVYAWNGTLLKRTCIFNGQAIHGIALLDSAPAPTAIVWGGPLVRPLSLVISDHGSVRIALGGVHTAKDWILDAAFAPSNRLLAGMVTAHNALTTVRIDQPNSEPSQRPEATLESRIPGSNCILYSAHLTWLSAFRCLVASGTSFGDVIVWSGILDEDGNAPTKRQIHFSFSAHDGSVFGLRLSPQLSVPGQDAQRVLVSCSDDRTVRLWDVSDLTNSTAAQHKQATGFGPRAKAAEHVPRCLAKAMGHISRIWHVRYAESEQADELVRIRSFGEDASVVTWALRNESPAHTLSPVHTLKSHGGKNVWSVATSNMPDLVATGGADGAIVVSSEDRSAAGFVELLNGTALESDGRDEYRSYDFVGPNSLISTTDRGSLVLITFSDSAGISGVAEISAPLDGLASYSCVTAVPSFAFVGGMNGAVYLYVHAERRVLELTRVRGKISAIFAQEQTSDAVVLLACTVNSTSASLFSLERLHQSYPHQTPTKAVELQLSKGFVTTSFAHYGAQQRSYAILGSRVGSVAVYIYRGDTRTILPQLLVTDVHGKEAVTALLWVGSETTPRCSEKHSLFSTGRDGNVAMHRVTLSGDRVELELVHKLSLPFGPNIEGMSVLGDANALVWGFKSKSFVVFDLNVQREVMTIECGGVHRTWAFQPASSGGRFVWTKASQLFQATQSSPPCDLIKFGGHGREIRAASVSSTDNEQIIATGAEDTDIKLFKVEGAVFRCLHTLRKHNTGIQHLQWHGSFLFSSGGFEEFFVWKIRRKMPVIGVAVVCEASHPRSGTSDLRIMGYHVQRMDASQHWMITMAYSDSTLKRWRYHCRSWELLGSADYLTSCLTQVFGATGDSDGLWTTASDGHLVRWAVDPDKQSLAWTSRQKVHQSSIHEVVCISVEGGKSLVISAGDDNAIGITKITDSGGMQTSLILRAHAAAVTGLAILPLRQGGYGLVSAGIDQRIKLWQIDAGFTRPGGDGIRVKRLYDVHTAVADVSGIGLCAFREDGVGILVRGVGMDLWRLPWAEGCEKVASQRRGVREWAIASSSEGMVEKA